MRLDSGLIKFAESKRRIDEADHGRGGEHEAVAVAGILPGGYGPDLQERVEQSEAAYRTGR